VRWWLRRRGYYCQ